MKKRIAIFITGLIFGIFAVIFFIFFGSAGISLIIDLILIFIFGVSLMYIALARPDLLERWSRSGRRRGRGSARSPMKVATEKPKYPKGTSFSQVETKGMREVEVEKGSPTSQIQGKIVELSENALKIEFKSGKSEWISLPLIHSEYLPDVGIQQNFLIDTWILKQKKII